VYTYHVCMNLTLSVSDDIVERAREAARRQGVSLNALVRGYLESLAGRADGTDLADRFDALWSERSGHSGGWRFDRDELYADRLDGPR
jgi:Family of unknown function (DUF6364)